ncbi:YgaP family membrane protein, partial [Neisseria sp. P0015.S004]
MKRNLGTLDRVIRIVIGVALIAAAATGHIGWWGWLGIIPLGTALIGNCALYSLLGI